MEATSSLLVDSPMHGRNIWPWDVRQARRVEGVVASRHEREEEDLPGESKERDNTRVIIEITSDFCFTVSITSCILLQVIHKPSQGMIVSSQEEI